MSIIDICGALSDKRGKEETSRQVERYLEITKRHRHRATLELRATEVVWMSMREQKLNELVASPTLSQMPGTLEHPVGPYWGEFVRSINDQKGPRYLCSLQIIYANGPDLLWRLGEAWENSKIDLDLIKIENPSIGDQVAMPLSLAELGRTIKVVSSLVT